MQFAELRNGTFEKRVPRREKLDVQTDQLENVLQGSSDTSVIVDHGDGWRPRRLSLHRDWLIPEHLVLFPWAKQPLDIPALIGITLITSGVIVMNAFSKSGLH